MLGWLRKIFSWWQGDGAGKQQPTPAEIAPPSRRERVLLTDGVSRTLFDDYAQHRRSERGDEEIGWILLGYRQAGEIIAVAALSAGTQRDAGAAHVLFNHDVQELASHILRQQAKKLGVVGVVHTHPGDLRQPSQGDFQGDRVWIEQLRGAVGVFGIGNINAGTEPLSAHQQCLSDMSFFWYVLGPGDLQYRPMAIQAIDGPDLATPFHDLWHILEAHAPALNRLYRQLAKIQCQRVEMDGEIGLAVNIGLTEQNQQLRLLLNDREARYYWDRDGDLIAIDPHEPQLDRAIYLILAELAKEATLVES